ncbi:RNA polymerase II subunit Rpb5a [Spironucleus salmonicida]|uniref:RNA polymerase II subunit Rpb5a n=1 Tax=Spironucleus salmonicida TaxID=348837 RepID=V6LV15_9EUKA|nr:RNA polymerase II subunit Rpb5a [Spironucleus salmonicida]|eukprot:EST48420.1 RNA polymerase II subunit Rpb5a [Spironucleus salmonicida]
MSELPSSKDCYKIRQTCCEMLADRGYILKNDAFASFQELSVQPFFEFEQKYASQPTNWVLYGEHLTRVSKNTSDKTPESIYLQCIPDLKSQTLDDVLNQMREKLYDRIIIVSFTGLPKKPLQEKLDIQSNASKVIAEVFSHDRLIFNITKHFLVPKHTLLTETEKLQILKTYKVSEDQLPVIEKTDPVARYLGLDQRNVVMITRISENSGKYINFRICK